MRLRPPGKGDGEPMVRTDAARRLIWLNPLLRWEGFAPKAQGIRAMLPHVDALRAGHSIATLEALAETLSRAEDGGERARLMAAMGG